MHAGELAIIWLLLGTLGLFAMIFGIRYLRNREKMAMIEKGLNPDVNKERPVPYHNLKWGLLLVGSGMGLLVAYILAEYVLVTHDKFGDYHDENPMIYFALVAVGGGLGLITSYRIEKKELLDKKDRA